MNGTNRRRAVITGMGSVNPLANSMAETWPKLVAGESGIGRIARFDPVELGLTTHIAGEVKGFDAAHHMDARAARRMDRFCQLGVAATFEAVRNAGLAIDDRNRDMIAVYFATGAGGLTTIVDQEGVRLTKGAGRVSPVTVPALMPNAAAGQIGLLMGVRGMAPGEIDYISAHGTSTPLNDRVETLAIKQVFGERAYQIPVSSLKSMVGHAAGACGGLEAAACAYTLREGIVPPTINFEHPDPECDLDYVPNAARPVPVRSALSNNFGFGGHNSCIILRQVD